MVNAVEGSQFTPEQLQYYVDHKNDSRVPNIIACASITSFLSTLFLILRLFGRWKVNGTLRLHLSDWLITVAWVFSLLSYVCFALFTRYGGGRHVIYITDSYLLQVLSILSEASYALGLGFIKGSVLALYGSIFPSRSFHVALWITAVFTVGWTLTSSLGAILQCIPVAKIHDPSLDGYCIHYGVLSLVVGILNILTDFLILGLPVPLVLRLNASAEKKRVIILTFAAGSSAALVSIVRLVYSLYVGTIDGSWDAVPAGYASCVELTVGIFVVSIPVYRKLYRKTVKGEVGESIAWSFRSDRIPLRHKFPYTSREGHSNMEVGYGYRGKVITNTQGGGSTQGIDRNSTHSSRNTIRPGHTITIKATEDSGIRSANSGISVTEDIDLVRLADRNGAWVRIDDESIPVGKS